MYVPLSSPTKLNHAQHAPARTASINRRNASGKLSSASTQKTVTREKRAASYIERSLEGFVHYQAMLLYHGALEGECEQRHVKVGGVQASSGFAKSNGSCLRIDRVTHVVQTRDGRSTHRRPK